MSKNTQHTMFNVAESLESDKFVTLKQQQHVNDWKIFEWNFFSVFLILLLMPFVCMFISQIDVDGIALRDLQEKFKDSHTHERSENKLLNRFFFSMWKPSGEKWN